jgi:hypothetical protein
MIATIKPFTNLNSLPEASTWLFHNSLTFILPALPQIIIPATHTNNPNNTKRPHEVPTRSAMVVQRF